jgi:hypothetical protein
MYSHPYGFGELLLAWKTPTGYITKLPAPQTRASPGLVEMWVVNPPFDNAIGVPIKGGIALGAPHLRTPTDFEYGYSTRRTGLGLLLQ